MPNTETPVYLIAGFLDSGKTSFINGILSDGFALEDRTLLLQCEDGEEEYDPELLRNVTVLPVEDLEGFFCRREVHSSSLQRLMRIISAFLSFSDIREAMFLVYISKLGPPTVAMI